MFWKLARLSVMPARKVLNQRVVNSFFAPKAHRSTRAPASTPTQSVVANGRKEGSKQEDPVQKEDPVKQENPTQPLSKPDQLMAEMSANPVPTSIPELSNQSPPTNAPDLSTQQPPTTSAPTESTDYSLLTSAFDEIESISSRLKIINIAANTFLSILHSRPTDLPATVYLCINKLAPDYQNIELGLGESLIIKALAESTARSIHQVRADYKAHGDLGLIALKSRKTQATMVVPKPLSVTAVYTSLYEIATLSGKDSQSRKLTVIKRLLTASKGPQAKYIVRSLEGKLRIGLAEMSVLSALAHAFVAREQGLQTIALKPDPDPAFAAAEAVFRKAHSLLPNYETIINAAIAGGIDAIPAACQLAPGTPLKPMLAKPTKSVADILDRFDNDSRLLCEYKYDGERAQVHASQNGLAVYSRNMEDMSQRYPDIADSIAAFANNDTQSYVLDCEAVAWDRSLNRLLPFQVLATRKRKDVDAGDITVRICLFAFDILFLNGVSLIDRPLAERKRLLESHFTPVPGRFDFAKSLVSNNVDEIQTFLDQSVRDSCEGLMVKALDGPDSAYEPCKRSRNWLKLKKDYISGVGDSLDLVVLGADYGKGKRTSLYGAFLLAAYNPDSEQYETVCKIGTGFSDEDLKNIHTRLAPTEIARPKSYYDHDTAPATQPDVWFEPTMVWEVRTADLSLSPVYRAGIDELGKGVSLRFPRFIRVRDDKAVEQATSTEQVVEFYRRQGN